MSQIARASFSFPPELEKAASKAGLPFSIIRSREEWLAHPQGKLLDSLPIAPIEKIGDAPPKPFPSNGTRPLEGIKVLLFAKAIAGPSCGRTLAEHGADVLIIVSDHGVEHEWIHNSAYLGCRSAFLNFSKPKDMETMWKLVEETDVFVEATPSQQNKRLGSLSKFGLNNEAIVARNPNIVIANIKCYGTTGPLASDPGFDMQGSAVTGLMAMSGKGPLEPAWPRAGMMNDYFTGYSAALAIQSALIRRTTEGGAWGISASLCASAMSYEKFFGFVDAEERAKYKWGSDELDKEHKFVEPRDERDACQVGADGFGSPRLEPAALS
ncbi:CoA-transferase family III domain-containing protein [Endogone sp. FLAS-F59071]|nr:CoA-transferase family III domain-containing protein [Endogone sp. FLAS-F59071]|eukprot:RUS19345.1 CoA-transferase family III domain-containing protein [Endogone sp. FLAS-F59071]